MDKEMTLYLGKIVVGTILGIFLGAMNIDPISIIDKLIYVGIIAVVLIMLTLILRLVLKIEQPLKKLLLLHGTFWYIVSVLGFWALVLNAF